MKKIPTLFERVFENHKKVGILPNVTPGMEWVLESPMFDKEGHAVIGQDLVKWLIEDKFNARVQIQLHKILEVQ